MTDLAQYIRNVIRDEGPMPLDRYMALCLGHPTMGYYMTRDPFGQAGDFTTAPEISQIFGELLGVWVVTQWQAMGAPYSFALVELGPGRGTLMADMLRVLAKQPDCLKAATVHFVETSPVLRDAQKQRVPHATWHHTVASLPALPTIMIANEFFDALPIRQFERSLGHTSEKVIGLSATGELVLGAAPTAFEIPILGQGIWEDATIRNAIAAQLADHLEKLGGAALIIDYGHMQSAFGDTLQAMKAHKFCAITENCGEADLTSHVDFEQLARGFMRGGAKIAGLLTQGDFLNAMGLQQRTAALAKNLDDVPRQNLLAASQRLAHPREMGHLFRVLAVTGGGLTQPYPFGAK
jgi:NADH dehydrogenase [ubiquinone] 1 alpha subcomplex assembly factor 7